MSDETAARPDTASTGADCEYELVVDGQPVYRFRGVQPVIFDDVAIPGPIRANPPAAPPAS